MYCLGHVTLFPGHVANMEIVTSNFNSYCGQPGCFIVSHISKFQRTLIANIRRVIEYLANLKSEATNEPDEDCEKVGHRENEDEHCKLTIAKPAAKE